MKRTLSLSVFLFLFVITQWSSSVYLPIAPKMAILFSSHKALIVSSLSLFFLGYAVGQLFWGILSDYIGRYVTLLIALTFYCIFELSMITVHNALWFVALLSITGFAVSANTSVGNAMIKDRYGKDAKSIIGYVGIAMACAPVVAPIIGSHLYLFGNWQSIFVFLSFIGFLILVLFSILFRKESDKYILKDKQANVMSKKPTVSIFLMLKETLLDKSFTAYISVLSITFGIFFSILLVTPFLLVDWAQFSVKAVGYLMFMITLTYIIGAVMNVLLTKRKDSGFIVNLGLVFMSFGSAIFLVNSFVLSHLISLINLLAIAICMLGIGVMLPASKAGAMLARNNHVGTAASVMKFTQTMGCVVLTKIASYCINHRHIEAFLITLVVMILLLTLFSIGTSAAMKVCKKITV